MMSDQNDKDIDDLDAFFAQVRQEPVPEISADAMARIMAGAVVPEPVAIVQAKPGIRDWIADLGGWPAMSGLMAAGFAGLWIGVAPTGAVSDVMAGMLGETVSVSLFPEADLFDLEAEG